jgi:hypothetical protein
LWLCRYYYYHPVKLFAANSELSDERNIGHQAYNAAAIPQTKKKRFGHYEHGIAAPTFCPKYNKKNPRRLVEDDRWRDLLPLLIFNYLCTKQP